MIPKIVHYCWLTKGDGKPMPPLVETCVASWRKRCPGWDIKLWNEDNFDLSANDFAREAYEAGKMAFAADYIRMYLLYHQGGVWLDTDVELLRPLDALLGNPAFTGIENVYAAAAGHVGLGAAVLGAEAGNPWVKAILDYYAGLRFVNPDGSLYMYTINAVHGIVTERLYGLKDCNGFRSLHADTHDYGDVTVYGKEVFYPHSAAQITPESVSIHRCVASWLPAVSVVMPAYNAEDTIAEAIESVLAQTFEKFELIIVDDGSTDGTRDVVSSFRDRRVVLVENAHDFIGSLNLGMRRATGKYIARMDADDVMLPERLDVQLRYMDAHPEADLLAAGMQLFGVHSYAVAPAARTVTLDEMLTGNQLAHPTVMLRRDSLKALTELYRREFPHNEDYDLWLRMLEAGLTLRTIPDILLRYRTHPAQVSAACFDEMIATGELVRLRYRPALTIIIPFIDEGDEVEKTVASIQATATTSPAIILINDGSTDGYDYKGVAERMGCRYVEHAERQGVAASRDHGVSLAETKYILLLDAHMELYDAGWDKRLLSHLAEHPRAVLCSRSRGLAPDRKHKHEALSAFGAHIDYGDPKKVFKVTWTATDSNPAGSLSPIGCVLGAAYAMPREYYNELHGLRGLRCYGFDEELLSMKVYRSGGEVLLVKDWVTGHIYGRQDVRTFVIRHVDNLYNQLMITELVMGDNERALMQARIAAAHGNGSSDDYKAAMEDIRKQAAFIADERAYLQGVFESSSGGPVSPREAFLRHRQHVETYSRRPQVINFQAKRTDEATDDPTSHCEEG
jgi:glycosyltransferase involved in cell wall biosynthesis